jgi:hypothetical protein
MLLNKKLFVFTGSKTNFSSHLFQFNIKFQKTTFSVHPSLLYVTWEWLHVQFRMFFSIRLNANAGLYTFKNRKCFMPENLFLF